MKPIKFEVSSVEPTTGSNAAYLIRDNWNDWFKYTTMFSLLYFDEQGKKIQVGALKIGQFNMSEDNSSPSIPANFERLSRDFFSLGQDVSYYSTLMELGDSISRALLTSLNDIAANRDLYQEAIKENVTKESLMRAISAKTVEEQFRRVISGGSILTEFRFRFTPANGTKDIYSAPSLEFKVKPESRPPSNIHILIGKNGVGKSHLLNSMKQSILARDHASGQFTSFGVAGEKTDDIPFANLVSVGFSAFDDFNCDDVESQDKQSVSYSYIGLRKTIKKSPGDSGSITLSPENLAREFAESSFQCSKGAKAERLIRALRLLESDPIFADEAVSKLRTCDSGSLPLEATRIFGNLSSGHKIVLLTITKLVEHVQEKTLVLIDEPEAHLHPPLLATFMRAVSELLTNRNGVAIVATHSPVVLQEVPRSCVWKIYRSGNSIKAERPLIETFAENVSVLTDEVFRLELTKSGFYKMLLDASSTAESVEEVVGLFDCQIGSEGYALISSMIALKQSREDA